MSYLDENGKPPYHAELILELAEDGVGLRHITTMMVKQGITKKEINTALDDLEDNGYIEVDGNDFELTEKGQALCDTFD